MLAKELMGLLGEGPVMDFSKYDIHTLATCLKRYFRVMAAHQPVVTFELYACVIATMTLPSDEGILTAKLSGLFRENLSPSRYRTLAYFIRFLQRLSEHPEQSQMNSRNLSICIGPNLFVSPIPDTLDTLTESLYANRALDLMIRKFPEVFPDMQFTDELLCDRATLERIARHPIDPSYTPRMMPEK
jgi:hypothetical protein